jgi:hypothetical protein
VETIPEEARDSEQEEEERLALIERDVQLAHPVIANGEWRGPFPGCSQWRWLQMKENDVGTLATTYSKAEGRFC